MGKDNKVIGYGGGQKASMFIRQPGAEAPFDVFEVVTLNAATAATPVPIVADSEVAGTGLKFYPETVLVVVNGAVAWTGVTNVVIEDTQGNAVFTIPVAALTANAIINTTTAGTSRGSGWLMGTGNAASAGLRVRANANASAGSPLVVQLRGLYANR